MIKPLTLILIAISALHPVDSNAQTWVSISAAGYHNLGLKSDNTLWSWGDNSDGELGDGTNTQRNSPVQIGTDNDWVNMVAGSYHNLGLKSDGTLWAWGYNFYGELGDGTGIDESSPVQIGTDNDWVSIAVGNNHSLALKSDGTLWAWGQNFFGQLGDGTGIDEISPVQIGTDNDWVSIAAGALHSFGIKSDGTLWAWGYNDYGQLGDGTVTWQYSPVQVPTDNNKWIAVAAGQYHNLGLKADSSLWAWGSNNNGKLGDGTFNDEMNPVQVGTDHNWVGIAAGYDHSLGLRSDSTVWAWGYNGQGQLGDGSNINQASPVQSGTDNTWGKIVAGFFHSIGLKSDRNQFCAVGSNIFGQLGDNTTIGKSSFICNTNSTCTSAPVVSNITGAAIVCSTVGTASTTTYSVVNIPEATSYIWSKSISLIQIVSGQYTNSINVTFSSSFMSGTLTLIVVNSCGTTIRTITINKKIPAIPGNINGDINPCAYTGTASGSPATYSINQVDGATSYIWTVPAGISIVGGTSPFTTTDTSITVSYPSLFNTGAIKVQAANSCGTSTMRSLTVKTKMPAMPGTINGPAEVCEYMEASTYIIRKVAGAALYNWTIPPTATVVAGGTDTTITVSFNNTFTTGSIAVAAVANCGISIFKHLVINKKLPATPGGITGPTAICYYVNNGTATYYINRVAGSGVTYEWSLPSGATLVSGGNDTTVTVSFDNSIASTSTIQVRSVRPCGNSAFRSMMLTKNSITAPTGINGPAFGECGQTAVSYTIIPVAAATGYLWSTSCGIISGPNNLGNVTVDFPSNFTSCNLNVIAVNGCGSSTMRVLAISGKPQTPSSISGNTSVCPASVGLYSVLGSTGATSYLWTVPPGATILSTLPYGASIQVLWGNTGGNITVKTSNACGASSIKALPVSISCFTGKGNTTDKTIATTELATANIYPNPNNGNFTLTIDSDNKTDDARIQIMDNLGQVVADYTKPNNKGIVLLHANEDQLKNGMYILKYTIGNEVRSLKFIIQK